MIFVDSEKFARAMNWVLNVKPLQVSYSQRSIFANSSTSEYRGRMDRISHFTVFKEFLGKHNLLRYILFLRTLASVPLESEAN